MRYSLDGDLMNDGNCDVYRWNFEGGPNALEFALTFLKQSDSSGEWNENDKCYAIRKIKDMANTFLSMEALDKVAPPVANVRKHLEKIEKLARDLEVALRGVTIWTANPIFRVMEPHERRDIENNFLYRDFPRPWDYDAEGSGAPTWQASLDTLSRLTGKAAQSIEGLSSGGPLNFAKLEFGNSKERLVIECSQLLFIFNKEHGYTSNGPLSRFVKAVHKYATNEEGNGWDDIIHEVAKWRRHQEPCWTALASLFAIDYITEHRPDKSSRIGQNSFELDELRNVMSSRIIENGNIADGPHALRRQKLGERGGKPEEK